MNALNAGTQLARETRAEASAWIAKLHGPERSAELEEDFRSWLSASPENARAFEHVTEIWDSIAHVEVGGLPRLPAHDSFDRPKVRVPLRAAAVCALVSGAAVAWFSLADGRYSTGIGEQRIVNLDDGSRIHMNSATAIEVDIGETTRRLRLERGEAFFEVAKDPNRPFVVTAGEHSVTALGTSFVVRRDSDRLAVTLIEGRVAVTESSVVPAPKGLQPARSTTVASARENPRASDSGSPPVVLDTAQQAGAVLMLSPGERVTFAQSGVATVDLPRLDALAAWRRGEVVLDDTPLSDAVSEMNRYQRQQLVLEDESIGTLPISGIYRAGSNEDFARAVATVYGLEVIHDGREIHLRAKQ